MMDQQAMEAVFVAALLDPGRAVPPGITTPRGEPDSLRFGVYRNNFHSSLSEALAAAYPVTRRIVGTGFFQAMARSYIALRKPRSPVLIRYGEDFPAFIAGFGPAAALPYLADVARLEQARLSAYHAAEAVPLEAARLGRWGPERLMSGRIVGHPAARLVRSDYAIGSIWRSHQAETVGKLVATPGEAVLVTRPEAAVNQTILPPEDVGFVEALLAGLAVAQAAEHASDQGFDAGRALAGLIRLGAVADIVPAEEAPW